MASQLHYNVVGGARLCRRIPMWSVAKRSKRFVFMSGCVFDRHTWFPFKSFNSSYHMGSTWDPVNMLISALEISEDPMPQSIVIETTG